MFSRKGKMRREKDAELIALLDRFKRQADEQDARIHQSVNASPEIERQSKLARAKYYFLLREARHRRTRFQ
ncbi:YaaL family protein [Salisediminibacterium selenitireducens]|uniref:YaaL n=1 Tax=Bacillus selenitireducens (strain ATCC 700615 / DSM 15326 / MLS10) TaxID=439292 RepID=D6XV19_BACIE|nr:YaaL family protein [Salisediminibacterium selenitireducens]ADH97577.1 Protein of unknown function DUF2508 [[Bacillus] selenitireducens MLS10]